ncbi:SDR family oxidoreductase [Paenibacillus sp. YPG26]|uniref:SDR family oxidoreductase n=1 Tax=Paenibacillus sp. YPG26 TaxID=2878915 RepID=UPI00203BFDA5|nr:SDR family oxidoreductase [Paenibacillus sp. YPG26]USB32932.1 SDR family oxidoreductase [Paenibacillus sp. YPG26]
MKTIFVAGAHGETGRRIVRDLIDAGYRVHGLVRTEDQAAAIRQVGAEPFIGDLNGVFSEGLKGADAVICAVGAGASGNPEEVDHLGTVRLIEQSILDGVERFILISSVGTLAPDQMPDLLKPFLLAKRRAEKVLEESTLNHTIIRPGGLTNEPPTGRVTTSIGATRHGRISRDDVAKAAVLALSLPQTELCAFEMIEGDVPLEEALQQLRQDQAQE